MNKYIPRGSEISSAKMFDFLVLGSNKRLVLFGKSQHWNIAPFSAVSESAIRTLIPQTAMFCAQYLVSPHDPL